MLVVCALPALADVFLGGDFCGCCGCAGSASTGCALFAAAAASSACKQFIFRITLKCLGTYVAMHALSSIASTVWLGVGVVNGKWLSTSCSLMHFTTPQRHHSKYSAVASVACTICIRSAWPDLYRELCQNELSIDLMGGVSFRLNSEWPYGPTTVFIFKTLNISLVVFLSPTCCNVSGIGNSGGSGRALLSCTSSCSGASLSNCSSLCGPRSPASNTKGVKKVALLVHGPLLLLLLVLAECQRLTAVARCSNGSTCTAATNKGNNRV